MAKIFREAVGWIRERFGAERVAARLKPSPITGIIYDGQIPVRMSPADEQAIKKARKEQLISRGKSAVRASAYSLAHPVKAARAYSALGSYRQRRHNLSVATNRILDFFENAVRRRPLQISSRVKRGDELIRKAEARGEDMRERMDESLGVRVILRNEKDCDMFVRILRAQKLKSTFVVKDYRKQPRAGSYRAVHIITDAFGPTLEIQLRTPEMLEETARTDEILGPYKGANKVNREMLDKSVEGLYKTFQQMKDRNLTEGEQREFKGLAVVFWAQQNHVDPEYVEHMSKVLKTAGMLKASTVRYIANTLKENEG